jgi:hypothetical protein
MAEVRSDLDDFVRIVFAGPRRAAGESASSRPSVGGRKNVQGYS